MPETDRALAESTYADTLLKQVPSESILKAIYTDNLEGLEAGAGHFEANESAWAELDKVARRAVRWAIGYWPGDAASF
jgi:hypothetical protein